MSVNSLAPAPAAPAAPAAEAQEAPLGIFDADGVSARRLIPLEGVGELSEKELISGFNSLRLHDATRFLEGLEKSDFKCAPPPCFNLFTLQMLTALSNEGIADYLNYLNTALCENSRGDLCLSYEDLVPLLGYVKDFPTLYNALKTVSKKSGDQERKVHATLKLEDKEGFIDKVCQNYPETRVFLQEQIGTHDDILLSITECAVDYKWISTLPDLFKDGTCCITPSMADFYFLPEQGCTVVKLTTEQFDGKSEEVYLWDDTDDAKKSEVVLGAIKNKEIEDFSVDTHGGGGAAAASPANDAFKAFYEAQPRRDVKGEELPFVLNFSESEFEEEEETIYNHIKKLVSRLTEEGVIGLGRLKVKTATKGEISDKGIKASAERVVEINYVSMVYSCPAPVIRFNRVCAYIDGVVPMILRFPKPISLDDSFMRSYPSLTSGIDGPTFRDLTPDSDLPPSERF